MKQKWLELPAEQIGGIIFICSIVFYFFIWSPFTSHNFTLRQEIHDQRCLLAELMAKEIELTKINFRHLHKKTSIEALSMLDQSLSHEGLRSAVSEISKTENNRIRIHFNAVSFDAFITWLTLCWEHLGMRVDQINIDADIYSGFVNAEVIF